jgi:hypothetical protein
VSQLGDPGEPIIAPRHDDLIRRVVVGHDHARLLAETADVVDAQADQGRHPTARVATHPAHRFAAGRYELEPVDEGEGTGSNQGRIFTEAVARHDVEGIIRLLDGRHLGDEDRRLGDCGRKHLRLAARGGARLFQDVVAENLRSALDMVGRGFKCGYDFAGSYTLAREKRRPHRSDLLR